MINVNPETGMTAEEEAAKNAYDLEQLAEMEERGALAGSPREMECYPCALFNRTDPPMRKVVALGPVVEERRDPTATYRLECGHLAV